MLNRVALDVDFGVCQGSHVVVTLQRKDSDVGAWSVSCLNLESANFST